MFVLMPFNAHILSKLVLCLFYFSITVALSKDLQKKSKDKQFYLISMFANFLSCIDMFLFNF